MDMSDMSMSMSATATATAATATTATPTASSSTDMSMSMSSSSSMEMQMTFTPHYLGSTVLFNGLTPTTPAAAFGVWILIFFVALLYRALVFARTYLEAVYWSPTSSTTAAAAAELRAFDPPPPAKGDDASAEDAGGVARVAGLSGLAQPFRIRREGARMLMVFVTAMLGYALMLVVMSFVVAWFFAVVTGLAVGEFVFARLTAGRTVGLHH